MFAEIGWRDVLLAHGRSSGPVLVVAVALVLTGAALAQSKPAVTVENASKPTVGDACPSDYGSLVTVKETGQQIVCVNSVWRDTTQGRAATWYALGTGTEADPYTGWEGVLDDAAACIKTAAQSMPNCNVVFDAGVYAAVDGAFSDYTNPAVGWAEGMVVKGAGMYNTLIRPVSVASEFWFYDNCTARTCSGDATVCTSDADCSGIGVEVCQCDSGDNKMVVPTFEDLSFQGYSPQTPNGYALIPDNANGFRLYSGSDNNYGFRFHRVGFMMLNTAFRIEGTVQGSETDFQSCFFNKIKGDMLYVNNRPSLNTRFVGTDAEVLYGDVIEFGPAGGGAVQIYGGSWVLLSNEDCESEEQGTHTGTDDAAALTDSAADFVALGVQNGDIIVNRSDSSWGTVTNVAVNVLTATLENGVENDWDSGDEWLLENGCEWTDRHFLFKSVEGSLTGVNQNRVNVYGAMIELRGNTGLFDTQFELTSTNPSGSSWNITFNGVRYLSDSTVGEKIIGYVGPWTQFVCRSCNHVEQWAGLYFKFMDTTRRSLNGLVRFEDSAVVYDFSERFLWTNAQYGRAECIGCYGEATNYTYTYEFEDHHAMDFTTPAHATGLRDSNVQLKKALLKFEWEGWPMYAPTFDTGTHDGAGNSADLIDSTSEFVQLGARVGDLIVNTTDGSAATITAISTTTNPNDTIEGVLAGGTDDDWDATDVWVLRRCNNERVAVLPAGAVIVNIRAYKPAQGADASDYQIIVGNEDKSTEYAESVQAAQNVLHEINVEDQYIEVGTTLNERSVRLFCDMTLTQSTEDENGGYAYVEYY